MILSLAQDLSLLKQKIDISYATFCCVTFSTKGDKTL